MAASSTPLLFPTASDLKVGELKLMVLKHAPLGEINLPFVASSANAPRCRRNRRYHTASVQ